MELTDKEERYSQLVVKLGNKSEALRQSYDCSNMTDKTITEKASRLSKKHNISTRIEELREEEKQTHGVDRDFIIKGYLEIINDTNHVFKLADLKDADTDTAKRFYRLKELTSNTDKIRAMESLSKMLGLNAPEKIDVNVTSFKTNWGE